MTFHDLPFYDALTHWRIWFLFLCCQYWWLTSFRERELDLMEVQMFFLELWGWLSSCFFSSVMKDPMQWFTLNTETACSWYTAPVDKVERRVRCVVPLSKQSMCHLVINCTKLLINLFASASHSLKQHLLSFPFSNSLFHMA